ncbi:MAG TPA: hypothetical protein VGN84_07750, partial [Solirubrobacterales bacterium]|nr:hypothetical protein [Solirubrobacterales bacterium]
MTNRATTARTLSRQTDPDRDGLSSWVEEHRTRTNPRKFDTDGDGFSDGAEVFAGSDPRNRASTPAGPPAPPPVIPPPPADTTAPNTTINSGPTGTIASTGASLGFGSSESGSTFQCKLDSGSWVSCISPKSYSGLTAGSHTFSVKAIDAAGNTDPSPATRSWTVQETTPPSPPADTTAPDTTIGSGPSGTTTATSASVAFGSSESGSTFQCKLDSGSWSTCVSPAAYSALAVGSHTFSVKATDAAGNIDTSPATQSWTVQAATPPTDTTAPDTTITSGPSGTTTATSASVAFSSTESGSTFQCQLDLGTWAGCTSAKAYSSLAVGAHTVAVKATDTAGNTDATPATDSWTVQSTESGGGASCTQTLSSGANLSTAVSSAAAGAVICLNSGSYSVNVTKANKSSMVTIKPAPGATPSLGYSMLNQATNLRFQELKFTGG